MKERRRILDVILAMEIQPEVISSLNTFEMKQQGNNGFRIKFSFFPQNVQFCFVCFIHQEKSFKRLLNCCFSGLSGVRILNISALQWAAAINLSAKFKPKATNLRN